MNNWDENRKRNQTISFRMSPEEKRQLNARIAVCGFPKAEFMIESLLHQRIEVRAGKYQSDRLSLELRRLREMLQSAESVEENVELLKECRALLAQVIEIAGGDAVL